MINRSFSERRDAALLKTLPPVKRARGWRLYTAQSRIVDLWQDGGRTLLGHKPQRVTAIIKSAADRGLFTSLPSYYQARFEKALTRLFPQKDIYSYKDAISARTALDRACGSGIKIPVWRPFGGEETRRVELSKIFYPILPFPLAPELLIADASLRDQLPASDPYPSVILAAATQVITELMVNPQRRIGNYPKITAALENGANWQREGIYLFRKIEIAQWEQLFAAFLKEGFLLPPFPDDPLILPGELSPGEEARLAKALML